jgi:hypothetical protein
MMEGLSIHSSFDADHFSPFYTISKNITEEEGRKKKNETREYTPYSRIQARISRRRSGTAINEQRQAQKAELTRKQGTKV